MTATNTENRYADVSLALKKGREQLISDLLAGNAPGFLEDQAQLIDDYFRQSYEKSVVGPKMGIAKNPYAVVALGGYGRAEQCVYSDVDLLFLFEKKVPKEAEDLVREIIYPLWDMGLDVGHGLLGVVGLPEVIDVFRQSVWIDPAVGVEVLEHLRRVALAERHQQHRGALGTG